MSKHAERIKAVKDVKKRIFGGSWGDNLKTPTDDVIDACYAELDGYTRSTFRIGGNCVFTYYKMGIEDVQFSGNCQLDHAVEMAFNLVN